MEVVDVLNNIGKLLKKHLFCPEILCISREFKVI